MRHRRAATRRGWAATAAAGLMGASAVAGTAVVTAPATQAAPIPATCSTQRVVTGILGGQRGTELTPSMFGIGLGQYRASVTADVSAAFGYPADSGAVVVTLENAYAHPTADDFVSGVNAVTTQGGTATPQPTTVTLGGTVGVILDFRPDRQWFNDDVKTVSTTDGSNLFFYPIHNPVGTLPPGFTSTPGPLATAPSFALEGPTDLEDSEQVDLDTLYLSELAGPFGAWTGFAATTGGFTFDSDQDNVGEYPTAFIFLWAACPEGRDDADETTTEVPVDVDVLANDPTPGMSVTGVGDPGHGDAVLQPDGTIRYTPDPGFSGVDTFTYTAYDPVTQNSVTQTVTITVTPVGADDTDTTPLNTPVDVDVLANDPSKNLTVQSVTQPEHGTAALNPDGTVRYTPDPGFSGVDTFTYTAVNPDGQTVTQTVTVTVTPLGVDDTETTELNTPVTVDVLENDPTNDLTVESVTQPSHGTVVLNPDGTVTYTPQEGFSGVDTFTYTAVDPAGQTVTQTVTITVTPKGVDDTATTTPGTPVTIPVLDNDPTTGLTLVSATPPGHGTVVLNPDGTITYTPEPGFTGTDTFTYTAVDAAGQTITQTVTVTVAGSAPTDPATPDPTDPGVPGPGTPDPTGPTNPAGPTSSTGPTNPAGPTSSTGTHTGQNELGETGAGSATALLVVGAGAVLLGGVVLVVRRRRLAS